LEELFVPFLWNMRLRNYVIQNYNGYEEKEIKEWDFSYITQAGFIILITTLLIYFSWVVVEKHIDKNK
jgi:hypothetical protein